MGTERSYWVYILASGLGGTLYIGVTNNLVRRVYEHKAGLAEGFTKRHKVHRLLYYEQFNDIVAAILREKQLKKWNRAWKVQLIERTNPNWDDLYPRISSP
jgi:putative endonuclease